MLKSLSLSLYHMHITFCTTINCYTILYQQLPHCTKLQWHCNDKESSLPHYFSAGPLKPCPSVRTEVYQLIVHEVIGW